MCKSLLLLNINRYLINMVPKYIFNISRNKYIFISTSNKYIINFFFFLYKHYNIQLKIFVDLVSLDYPNKNNRFRLIYNLNSYIYGLRFFIKFWVNYDLYVNSITKLYPSSNWYEREIFDLYGVFFINHNDLRRILTDYTFYGHPLRKDFPLSGFFEIKYKEKFKSVFYKPIKLKQEYRFFELKSPWRYF